MSSIRHGSISLGKSLLKIIKRLNFKDHFRTSFTLFIADDLLTTILDSAS